MVWSCTNRVCQHTKEKNRSLNETLSDDNKKEENNFDEGDHTDLNDTVTFNVVVDLKDTSLHKTENSVDDESTFSNEDDEKVMFGELKEKYNLMYAKWVKLLEINKAFKKDLQDVPKQKESLEQRNYEFIAQVKDVTERLNLTDSRITRMNKGKAKLEKMLQAKRRTGLKTGLGYIG